MTTLARRPAPGSPGVFDVPVAVVSGRFLALAGDSAAESLAAIDQALDELIRVIDSGQVIGAERRKQDLAAVERLGRRLDAARLRLVAQADREGVAERAGHADTGAWVARTTKGDRRAAARDVHLATALGAPSSVTADDGGAAAAGGGTETAAGAAGSPETAPTLDLTRDSLDAGDLSAAHARVIAQAMQELPDGVSAEDRRRCEAGLVRLAGGRSPAQLRLLARRAVEEIEPDPAAVDAHEDAIVQSEEERAYEAAAFWIRDNHDGTMTGQFTVPWASGMTLKKVLDAMTAPRRLGPDGVRRQAAGDDYRWNQIDWQHRRGAAFADLLLRVPTDHLSPKVAATLIVTTRLDDLRGELTRVGRTDSADVVSASEARRLACGAGIIPAVLDGESLPLDLGRQKRLYSEAQRVAFATRYDECATEGCDRPFAWCEIHHLHAWQAGGSTDLASGVPLCGRHHRMIDDQHLQHTVRQLDDGCKVVRFHRRT